MLFSVIVVGLLAASVAISSNVPSDETLTIAFDRGQRFYVIEDFEQAIEKFEIVTQAEDSRFVDETKVLISVGELDFPVKVAATFQLANSYSNLAVALNEKAGRTKDAEQEGQLREQADDHFRRAAELYDAASTSTNLLEIQVLSKYQLVKTRFRSRQYELVIADARDLIERFPDSDYVDEALYEMGWAHYNLKQFPEAIVAFQRLASSASADYRIDRARFQIGKSYFEQEAYSEARQVLSTLIGKYDFSDLSQSERVRMEAQKLSGVVKETALELVAKAHLLIGDTYTAEGDVGAASRAYRRVIEDYPQERQLVENAYVKIGGAHFKQGDTDGGVAVLRRSIDEVSDLGFRARMQARIGKQYYAARRFDEALAEYEIYRRAYDRVASRGGLTLDRALFQVAQCHFEAAEGLRGDDDGPAAKRYNQAEKTYQQVLSDYYSTDLGAESLFGASLAAQRRGDPAALIRALDGFGTIRSEHGHRANIVRRSHLQMARVQYSRSEVSAAVQLYDEFLKAYPQAEQLDRVFLEFALALRDDEQHERAVATLEQIPAASVIWAKAGLMGGELLLRQGQLAKAEEFLQRAAMAARDDGVSPERDYVLARVYFEQGRYDESIEAFQRVLDNTDNLTLRQGGLLGVGTAHFKTGEFGPAVARLEELLTAAPTAVMKDQAHRLLGQCYVQMGRRAQAIKDYEAIIAASSNAVERAELSLLLAELFYSLERYEDAASRAQNIIDADFADDSGGRGYFLKERAYFVMGDAYTRMEMHAEARRIFVLGLQSYPRSSLRPDLMFGRAFTTFALGESDSAVPLLHQFIDEYPDNPNIENTYYFLAYSYLRQTAFAEAATWFRTLAERFPHGELVAEAVFQVGENMFNLSRYEEASVAYQQIVEAHPTSEYADNSIYNLGWCKFELDRQQEAIGSFRELIERFPDSPFAPSAQFTLGDYYFNEKDYDRAAEIYTLVVRKFPQSEVASEARELLVELEEIQAYVRYERAMAFFDAQEYESAAVALAEVVESYPKTDTRAGALANLGMSYEFLRQWRDAARAYGDLIDNYGQDVENAAAVAFALEHKTWITSNRL